MSDRNEATQFDDDVRMFAMEVLGKHAKCNAGQAREILLQNERRIIPQSCAFASITAAGHELVIAIRREKGNRTVRVNLKKVWKQLQPATAAA